MGGVTASQILNTKEVYNRHTTDKQSAEIAEVSQEVEQNGTQTSSRMNTPILSPCKGSDNIENGQKNKDIAVRKKQPKPLCQN